MASALSSIANLFSFFTASPPPKPPPSKLHLSSSAAASSSSSATKKERWSPLVATGEAHASPHDAMAVACPSLAYANTLYYQSYNVQVIVDENEPEEKLIGRFKREVMRAGVIQEVKRRRFFENKQEEKKRRTRDAARRNRRRRMQSNPRFAPQDRPEETSKSKKSDDDDDNWDLPEGVLT